MKAMEWWEQYSHVIMSQPISDEWKQAGIRSNSPSTSSDREPRLRPTSISSIVVCHTSLSLHWAFHGQDDLSSGGPVCFYPRSPACSWVARILSSSSSFLKFRSTNTVYTDHPLLRHCTGRLSQKTIWWTQGSRSYLHQLVWTPWHGSEVGDEVRWLVQDEGNDS